MELPKIECGNIRGVSIDGVMDALADDGFRPKRHDEECVAFKREGKNYLARCFENDQTFRILMAPRIYEIAEGDDRGAVLTAINQINCELSVGKIYLHKDAVWVTVEVRHRHMGAAAELLMAYIDDIDAVVQAFSRHLEDANDSQAHTLQ